MIYCRPVFQRGAGLGTRLFPWARCRVFSHKHGIPMLAPQWVQPRIGPLLRGGIDIKSYAHQILLVNLFKKRRNEINGIKRLHVRLTAVRATEGDASNFSEISAAKNLLIDFEGAGDMFQSLQGWEQFLHRELRAMTKPHWVQMVDKIPEVPIGINVRLGNDFKNATSKEDYYTKGAVKTPLSWFVESLKRVREVIGASAKAFVVSDGREKDLESLLSLDNVFFVRPGCAISDLLLLSKSKIFIASGGSSFSAWASFLGEMPTISHPGQSLRWFKINDSGRRYLGEFDPARPPNTFAEEIAKVL